MKADFKFQQNNVDQQKWLSDICKDFNSQVKNEDKITYRVDESKNQVVFYKSLGVKPVCIGNMVKGKLQLEQYQSENKPEKKNIKDYLVKKVAKPIGKKIGGLLPKTENIGDSFKWDKINKNDNRVQFLQNLADSKPQPVDTRDRPSNSDGYKAEQHSEDSFDSGFHQQEGKGRYSDRESYDRSYSSNTGAGQRQQRAGNGGYRQDSYDSSYSNTSESEYRRQGKRRFTKPEYEKQEQYSRPNSYDTSHSRSSPSSALEKSRNEYLNETLSKFTEIKEKNPALNSIQRKVRVMIISGV